ncbi:MAG: Npun_R2821/Npun_R2822 family protein [Elainellaceae cyanobacterium]
MTRGIYITANDRVLSHAIALMNSIRLHDEATPVVLIPYDENYEAVAEVLNERFGVTVYEDLGFIERLSQRLFATFGEGFFARPNQFRKQACWFGPFDEFLYIDTDIVVFEAIANNLNYLDEYDFICCDYQHRGGITNVFTQAVLDEGVFTEADLADTFNGGLWGAKRGVFTEADLYQTFEECAAHPHYFDFSQKTSDQPIINYMVLKRIAKRFNIVRRPGGAPGSWAGSPHFVAYDHILYDSHLDQSLQYLHWAGIRIEPGCPYWSIWEHYRYLHEPTPPAKPQRQFWRRMKSKVRSLVKQS